jgi:hypothetical protein
MCVCVRCICVCVCVCVCVCMARGEQISGCGSSSHKLVLLIVLVPKLEIVRAVVRFVLDAHAHAKRCASMLAAARRHAIAAHGGRYGRRTGLAN